MTEVMGRRYAVGWKAIRQEKKSASEIAILMRPSAAKAVIHLYDLRRGLKPRLFKTNAKADFFPSG